MDFYSFKNHMQKLVVIDFPHHTNNIINKLSRVIYRSASKNSAFSKEHSTKVKNSFPKNYFTLMISNDHDNDMTYDMTMI